jgi:shikimate kinase
MTRRVVLVGFMGAGKTTVGRLLADELGFRFVDLDERIVARTGRTVAAIFAEDGEAAFRALEREAARAEAGSVDVVIAAGGGAVLDPATRAALYEGATSVWLRCARDTLLARIPADGSRPLAANRATIGALLSEREPIYRRADLVVDTTSAAPRDTARELARALRRPGTGPVRR